MTRRIRIHNPEDNDTAHKNVKIILGSLFCNSTASPQEILKWVDDNFEIKRFVCARDALNYYNSPNAEPPDLLLCDIDFTEEQCGETATAGIDILKSVREKFPNTVTAYLTGQEAEDEVRPHIEPLWNFLPPECRIVRRDVETMSNDLKRKFPLLLRKVTKTYLEKASTDELEQLWKCLDEDDFTLDGIANVAGEAWQIKHLFVGHTMLAESKLGEDGVTVITSWRFLGEEEFVVEVKRKLSSYFGITYAFSKCFGRWGVKEITHGNDNKLNSQGYYYIDKRLAQCIDQQVSDLLQRIQEFPEDLMRDPVIQQIVGSVNKFKTEWEKDKHKVYSRSLKNIRDENFQWTGIRITEAVKTISSATASAIELQTLPETDQLVRFEVNIPIHLIFEDALRQLLTPKKMKLGQTQILAGGRRILEEPLEDNYHPAVLYENYLVIRYEKLLQKTDLLSTSPPDFILSFHNKNIDVFGRYYIALLNDGSTYYDVSHQNIKSVSRDLVFGTADHPIEKIINNPDNKFKTYHIFIFSAWRQ